mgnify:CR=1 FL=1
MSTREVSVGIAKVLFTLTCTTVLLPRLWWAIGLPFSPFVAGHNALWYAGIAFGAFALFRAALDVVRGKQLDAFTYSVWALLIQHALNWGAVGAIM